MGDKKIHIIAGDSNVRPVTNAVCVKAAGIGDIQKALDGHVALPLGIIATGNINTNTSRYSTSKVALTSVVMKEPFLIPYSGVTFHISIDKSLDDLYIIVYYGYNEGVTGTTSNVSKYSSSRLINNSLFTFPINHGGITATGYDMTTYYYRIGFFSESLSLNENDIKEYIRLGYISITYRDDTPNVVTRNMRANEVIEASKTKRLPTRHKNFVFTHISDLHGNGIALMDALKYSRAINSQGLFITGDVVVQSSYDGYGYIHEFCKDFDFPSFVSSGNHDGVGQTLSLFNSNYFGDMSNSFGYEIDTSVGYYYKDLTDPKIRVIALDCCDSTSNYRISSVRSTQLSWLTKTLNSVPTGFGVIIIMHQPLDNLTEESVAAHPTFAKFGAMDNAEINWTGVSGIKGAVDDFIDNGGEFIMYCGGHYHADIVGFIKGTENPQLMALVGSTNRMQDMHLEDGGLGDGIGNARDLFNAYVIDRVSKTVRVIRVGSNVYTDLTERLVEEFSY